MSEEEDLHPHEPPISDLTNLPQELPPPAGLEGQIVDRLVAKRLLIHNPSRKSVLWPTRVALVAATIVVAFVAGRMTSPGFDRGASGEAVETGQASGQATGQASGQPTAAGSRYALLLYSAPESAPGDDGIGLDRRSEYIAWAQQTANGGRFVDGEELGRREVTVGVKPEAATPRPVPPSVLSGFFVVEATDFDEAVALAQNHPHVRHDGVIRVRAIVVE